ncbi:antirestriction protein, partial [Escherichia coli]
CRASIKAGRTGGDAGAQGKPQPDAHGWRELQGEAAKPERANDRKITADGKEGPGDRSGEAYPCINASPAKMEARHSPHTALRPHN